jgi:hypothetical protein
VAAVLAEPDSPGYWFAASRDGNREAHYRGPHLGATLVHPLHLGPHGEAGTVEHPGGRPGLGLSRALPCVPLAVSGRLAAGRKAPKSMTVAAKRMRCSM